MLTSRFARTVWVIAGLCWAGMLGAVLFGVEAHAHHDIVLEDSALSWPVRLALFAAVWQVMIGAMMLPTTIPMLEAFWTASAGSPKAAAARGAVVTPYLLVWLGFAWLALAGDLVVHRAVDASGWLAAREGLILGGTLMLAGFFQFSRLKRTCLMAGRSMTGRLEEYYTGGVRGAWRLGVRHALFCLGCCWALMLVMFAVGAASLTWMLLLTALMVGEKVTARGRRLVAPAGVAFVAAGAAVCVAAVVAPA